MGKRVVVIGGGIVGASIAFHLQERGATVTLIDSDPHPPNQASRASFAWMNARDKNPRSYHDLNRRSLDMWPRFADHLKADIKLEWGGDIRWTTTKAEAAESEFRVKLLQSWGYPTRTIDRDEAGRLAPGVSFNEFVNGSFSEIDGHVDAVETVRALKSAAQEQGTTVRLAEPVTGLELKDGIRAVLTDEDAYPCDVCVVAAGADSPDLAIFADVDIPMYHTFGATVVTSPAPSIFNGPSVLHGPKNSEIPLAIRQFADGTTVLHGGSHGQMHDESYGQSDVEVVRILEAAKQIAPGLSDVELLEARSARRPIPEDGLSVVGFADAVANLYVAVTHSGVTLAPLIGKMATIEIMDAQRVDILEPFRLGRFGRQP